MTSIWRPRRPSHMLKNNFITWYYPLWMVEVLENVFKGIICSFAVNNGSDLWRYWNQMFALFPAAIFCSSEEHKYGIPIVSLINFCYILKSNSEVENCAGVRLGLVFNLLIFWNLKLLASDTPWFWFIVFDCITVKTTNRVLLLCYVQNT